MAQNDDNPETAEGNGSDAPPVPITSRFLFVDVAAQRAKQLRRGALARLERSTPSSVAPHKLERIAMEEVRAGLVQYTLPTAEEFAQRKS